MLSDPSLINLSPRARMLSCDDSESLQEDVEEIIMIPPSPPSPPSTPPRRTSTFNFMRLASLRMQGDDAARSQKQQDADDEAIFQIKIKILMKNPAIFQMYKDRIIESNLHYSNGARMVLYEFLENDLRMPEVFEELIQETRARRPPRGLLAYLTGGDNSYTRRTKARRRKHHHHHHRHRHHHKSSSSSNRKSRHHRRKHSDGDTTVISMGGLSLPSLDPTEATADQSSSSTSSSSCSDDNDDDDGYSCADESTCAGSIASYSLSSVTSHQSTP